MNQALFTLGKVTGVHGLKGHVKVLSHADSPSVFKPGFSLFVRGEDVEGVWYEIEDASPYKKGMRILFKGADRNLAESLVGKVMEVLIERKEKGKWLSKTRTHRTVLVESEDNLMGRLLQVKICRNRKGILEGIPV